MAKVRTIEFSDGSVATKRDGEYLHIAVANVDGEVVRICVDYFDLTQIVDFLDTAANRLERKLSKLGFSDE